LEDGVQAFIFLARLSYNKMAIGNDKGGTMRVRWAPLVSAAVMTGVCVFLLTGYVLQEEYMVLLLVGLCVAMF